MDKEARVKLVAQIFEEHGPAIRSLIRRYVRDEHDADDLYQNVFLSLVRTPPSSLTFLLAYLRRVVKNHVTDLTRRYESYNNCVSRYRDQQQDDALTADAETQVALTEQTCKMSEFFESVLPPHMAHVLRERCSNGNSVDETAQKLGLNPRTVSRYYCVALKRIREVMQEGKAYPDFLCRRPMDC